MTRLLLGIDVGTSGVKSGVFDVDGTLLGLGRAMHAVDAPRPGWAQCDPEFWWRGVVESLAQACQAARVRPDEIDAIGLGVLFPAVMPLDARGRALHPAILYCDQRSLAHVRAIRERIPAKEYEALVGNVLVPGTSAVTSIAWLRDEAPEAYSKSKCVGFANTFVTSRLTGEFRTDPSMAALSGLVDMREPWRWSESLCETLDIDAGRLPRIVGPAEVVGAVTRDAAAETGLRVGAPVVCGAGDVGVCTFGAGALPGKAIAYIAGSTDCVAVPMPRPTDDRKWLNCTYIPQKTWMGIGTTTSSGASVEWFLRECAPTGMDGERARIDALAEASPPGANGLLYLPYLQGERSPIWDPLARGMFLGLTARTTRGDLARAVLEGTAFALRQVLEDLDTVAGGPVEQIRALGGGTRNALWNQIKADVLERELAVLEFQEAGAFGAALLAGLGARAYRSFEEAVALAREKVAARTVTPDPARAELYRARFALHAHAYPRTRELMHELAASSQGNP